MPIEKLDPNQLRAQELGISENQMDWMDKHADWLAGFIYGAGWMGFVDQGKRGDEYPIILFSSTDLERLNGIRDHIGGTLSHRSNPPGGRLRIGPELTTWVARLIEPYALTRKPLIDQMLKWNVMTDRAKRTGFIATQTSTKNDRLTLAASCDYTEAVSNSAFVGGFVDAKARLAEVDGVQKLAIRSTNHYILLALQERFGGGLVIDAERSKIENADSYRWLLAGPQVYEFLDLIKDHTFLSRDTIDRILRHTLSGSEVPSSYIQKVRDHIRLSRRGIAGYRSQRISDFLEGNSYIVLQAYENMVDETLGEGHTPHMTELELRTTFMNIASRLLQGSDRAYIQGAVDTSPVVDNILLTGILNIVASEFWAGVIQGFNVRMLATFMPYHSIDFISDFCNKYKDKRFLPDGTLLILARRNPRSPVEAVENYLRTCRELIQVANSNGFPHLSDGSIHIFARSHTKSEPSFIYEKLVAWQELQQRYKWMSPASVWTAVTSYADSNAGIQAMIARISIKFPLSLDSDSNQNGAPFHGFVKDTLTPDPEAEVMNTERSDEISIRIQRLFDRIDLSRDDRSFLVDFILAQNDSADQERLVFDWKMTWEEISERGERLLKYVQGFVN